MSLRCGKCTAAFFSNKLLEKHQSKCIGSGGGSSNLSSKSQFVVNVSFPVSNASTVAAEQDSGVAKFVPDDPVEQSTLAAIGDDDDDEPPAKKPMTAAAAQEAVAAASSSSSSSSSDVENVSPRPLTAAASADLPDVDDNDNNDGVDPNAGALDANSRQRRNSPSQSQSGCSYCCGLCNETYSDVPSLLKHFADRHPEFSTDELTLPDQQQQQQQQQHTMYFPYVCTLCNQAFDQLSAGRDHLRERHPTEWRQICRCPVCDVDCVDESGVAAHVSEIHADPKVGAGSGVFACRVNGGQCRPCSSPEQLRLHYLSEHVRTIGAYIVEGLRAVSADELPDTVYECGACRDRFADREKLEMHFATGCPALETMETNENVGQQQQQQQFQHQAEQQQQPDPMEADELNGHRPSAESTVVTSADSLLQQSQPPDAAGASVTVASSA